MSIDSAPATRIPADLRAWTARFRVAEIPVLCDTAAALEQMRANEDAVDASGLAALIADDPLMTLKLLAHLAQRRGSRVITDVETVTAALLMIGIAPFFRAFGAQPSIDETLHDVPQALAGLREVLRRAHRAGRFALGIAVRRMDPDAAVIHSAALLHDFAEMLLWCHEPALALDIQRRQQADLALRSSAAQQAVLGIQLPDLQQALMRAWRLPELLIRITDNHHAEHPSVRNVALAIRLARHTARGWDNPAVPDDVREIASLLNVSVEASGELLRELED